MIYIREINLPYSLKKLTVSVWSIEEDEEELPFSDTAFWGQLETVIFEGDDDICENWKPLFPC